MSENYKADVKHKLKSTPKDLTQLEAAGKKNTDKVKQNFLVMLSSDLAK